MTATTAPVTPSAKLQLIGQYVQLGGIGAFVAGAILSVHHYAIGACLLAGVVAYYVGGKLKAS